MGIGVIHMASNLSEKSLNMNVATRLPSMRHFNPLVGREGQKKKLLKMENVMFTFSNDSTTVFSHCPLHSLTLYFVVK
jgi:hypothetical protein